MFVLTTIITTTARIRTAAVSAIIAIRNPSMMTIVIMRMMVVFIHTMFVLTTIITTTARIRTAAVSAIIAIRNPSMMTIVIIPIFFHIVNFLAMLL
jgi:hypothetical protein